MRTVPFGTKRVARTQRDERGAFIVMWALLLVAILTMVAIVVDLGQQRSLRRDSQRIADLAALAAGPELSGSRPSGLSVAPFVTDARAACRDAIRYVRSNAPELDAATLNSFPCNSLPSAGTCVNPGGSLPATAELRPSVTSGDWVVTVVYPVTDATMNAAARGGQTLTTEDGNPCGRMQVNITRSFKTMFGGIAGIDTLRSTLSATVNAFGRYGEESTPSILILERTSCGALQTSGQGGIVVRGFGERAGLIHVDSSGSACPGATAANANNYVVYATPLPSTGLPSIKAEPAESGSPQLPAQFRIFALTPGENPTHAYQTPNGVFPTPMAGEVAGRRAIDNRYACYLSAPACTNGPTPLRTTALNLSNSMPAAGNATPPPSGYVRLSSLLPPGQGCNALNGRNQLRISEPNVYIDCSMVNPQAELLFTGNNFVTSDRIQVGSGNRVVFSNPSLLVVKNTDNSRSGIDVQGTFEVNNGQANFGDDTNDPVGGGSFCATRRGPASSAQPARVVVLNGPLTTGAQSKIRFCQSTVYMAGLTSPRADNDNNTDTGYLSVGGAGGLDWSAPNQETRPYCRPGLVPPTCYTTNNNPLEDLAFWTESAQASRIGGQGSIFVTGVFFLPNARPFEFAGQAVQLIDRDAQFIARRLNMSGQGLLQLKPNPNNAVAIQESRWALIR